MKKKLFTILLVALMLIGSVPVMADEGEMTPTTYAGIKEAFPQAQIIEGNPNVKIVQVVNGETVYGYLSFNPDAEPVATYTKEFSDGTMTLDVFADGSYSAVTMTRIIPSGARAVNADSSFRARYSGMLGSYAQFYIDYGTNGLVTKGPYDIYFYPFGGQSWRNEGYGTMLARTAAYLNIGIYNITYDGVTGVVNGYEHVMTVQLRAYVNGGDPYSNSGTL